MKMKKKEILKGIGLLLAALLTVGQTNLTAYAEDMQGSIQGTLSTEAVGAEITLYAVADIESGEFFYRTPFTDPGFTHEDLGNSEKVSAAIEQLAATAQEQHVAGVQAKVDDTGKVAFTELSPALYLLVQTGGEEAGILIQSSIVPIPYTGEEGVPVFDVEINLKGEKVTENVPPKQPEGSSGKKQVKTGDNAKVMPYAVAGIMALIVIIGIGLWYKKKKK